MIHIKIRVIIGVMIFFGYFIIYVIRYNLSVHIVDMVQVSKREVVFQHDLTTVQRSGVLEMINWNEMRMAIIFTAYHIGYCVCFPIFHNLGDRFGPKWVVGISGILSGLSCCLTPAAAYHDYWVLFFVRIVQGFCAGAMQPSMVEVLSHWVPPIERNHFMWAYCGITMGTCSTFLLCAAIQYYSRWPVGFYFSGTAQLVWALSWIFLVTDLPKDHSCITDEELTYLDNTIGTIFTIKSMNYQTPWKLILKSVPCWALCILNFGYSWMIISLALYGPLFYSYVVKYNIYQASALTALPFFLRLILGTIVIQLFHRYKQTVNYERYKHFRKYLIVVSHVIPGLLITFSWFFPIVPGPIMLTLAVTLTAAGTDLTLDICSVLTPNFANSLLTVIKIIGNTSGILMSLCVGYVTQKYKNTPLVWKHIWSFNATILLLSGVFFLIWGETETQPWNYYKQRPQPKPVGMHSSVMSRITEVEEENASVDILS